MSQDYKSNSADFSAPDANLYEYAVIRYVPKIEREEFLNIGLIMMCKRRKWLHAKIKINEEKIFSLFPFSDIESLRRQAAIFTRCDVPSPDLPIEEKYRWLTAAKSAVLQTSQSHPGIAEEELEAAFCRLFTELVE